MMHSLRNINMFGRKKERERDQRGSPLGTEKKFKTKEKFNRYVYHQI